MTFLANNEPMSVEDYNDLALAAFDGNREAAEELIVEAAARGNAYDPDAVIAWVSARGPFDMSEAATGEKSYAAEAIRFLQESSVFTAAEALDTAVAAAKAQKDLVEYDGFLDIPARAPAEVLEALGIEVDFDPSSDKSLAEQIGSAAKKSKAVPALLIGGGIILGGLALKKLFWD